jgi:hypothetical protein
MHDDATITAIHLSPSNELHSFNIDEYEKESFAPILAESKQLDQKITTIFKPSNDIDADVAGMANKGEYDLLLVGFQQSIFEGSFLGKLLGFTARIINPDRFIDKVKGKEKLFENTPFNERTQVILSKTEVPVGILIDKNLPVIRRVFVPVLDASDEFLLAYAERLVRNVSARITIVDMAGEVRTSENMNNWIKNMQVKFPGSLSIASNLKIERRFLLQFDLMLISVDGWKKLLTAQSLWLSYTPSNLILKP